MSPNSKTMIITGGLGVIGLSLAKYFYNKNFNVIIIDNKSKILFSKIKFKDKVNFINYYKLNLLNSKLIKSKISYIIKKFNKIDILINCAGIQHIDKIESFPDIKWQQIININLSSSFYTSKYILPLMKKNKWGRIINISSVHGIVASSNKSAYVASKHGMIGLTKSIALETAQMPITCNAICPGWVDTPLITKQILLNSKKNNLSFKKSLKDLLEKKQPSLKFISTKAIASLAYYLCSDSASEITGSSINIDGGWISQ